MVNSKYLFPISEKMLTIVKANNKKKIYCSYHQDTKLSMIGKQRVCPICNKRQKQEASKRYLQKKELAKSSKFTIKF